MKQIIVRFEPQPNFNKTPRAQKTETACMLTIKNA